MISVDFCVISINTPSFKSEKFVHSSLFLLSSCHRGWRVKQQGNFPLSFPSCPSPLLWPFCSPLCLLPLPFPAFNSVSPFSMTLGLTFSFPFWSPKGAFSCFSPPWVLFYLMPLFPPWVMHPGILYDSRLPSSALRFTSDMGLGTFPFIR